jgi:excisionase family DNA binding protein
MKLPPTKTLLMPMAEAVTFTGLSERTLWRLVQKRKVPHVRIGRRLLFRREALAKWVQDLEVQR